MDFPPPHDKQYDFHPRPIEPKPPLGPIAEAEFRERFYTYCEDCCHSWHQEQMRRWLPGKFDSEATKALPKRKVPLEMQDGKREFFWGLLVRERRSGALVLAYVCLFNVPGLVFFFLWLFRWGHGGDLQNASVPPTVSLSLTFGFVAWLVQSREGNVR